MSSSFRDYMAKRQSQPNALAEAAIALGVPVFACNLEKKPVTEHGLHDASAEPDTIRSMFQRAGTALIGMPTGAVSGVVIVDVDIEAGKQGGAWLDANSHRLPQTRTIKTRSGGLHLYFIASLDDGVRNSQSKIAPGVDVRGAGGYVIVPPSAGYSVADDAMPASIPEWLLAALQSTPTPVLALSGQPASRRREDASTGGTPYGHTALDDECQAILSAGWGMQEHTLNAAALKIGQLIGGGELSEGEAIAALLSAGRGMANQPGRAPWRPAEVEKKVRRGVADGMRTPRSADPLPLEIHPAAALIAKMHEREAKRHVKPLPVSADLLDVDGALKMFVDHCQATAFSPQPFLALAAGICAIGALAGRRYCTRTDLRTNVYAIGIADSGGGKDHARKQIKAAFGAAGLTQYLGGEDIASGPAMLTALFRHPSILFQIDEFGDWLAGVLGKNAPTHKRQIAEKLKALYSSADSWIAGTEYANQDIKSGTPRRDIQQPHACLYGTTTPGQFWSAIQGSSMHDGLLARVLIFLSPISYPDEQNAIALSPPPELIEAFQAIAAGAEGHDAGNLPWGAVAGHDAYTVEASPEGEQAIQALRREQLAFQRGSEGTYVTAIAARWAENAVKLALIRAVSRNPGHPAIQVGDVTWGRALAKHCMDTLLQDAQRYVAETEYERKVKRVVEIIRKHGPVSTAEMDKRHGFTLPGRELADLIRDLLAHERIQAIPTEAGKRGRPTVRYVLVSVDDALTGVDEDDLRGD